MYKMANRGSYILVLVTIFCPLLQCDILNRSKRTLVWPPGGSKLLVIIGFGLPVDYEPQSIITGTVLKANYRYPTNATQLTQPFVTYERKKRAVTRWSIYSLLSQAIEMRGFEGKSCILRAICDVARAPLERNFGLYNELVHAIFTPSSTKEKVNHHSDNEYYAAQSFGKNGLDCEKIFKDCSNSLIDILTVS